MKQLRYRLGTGLLLLIWMAVIFSFSAQPGGESGMVSGTFSYRMMSAADWVFGLDLPEDEMEEGIQLLDHPVRKAAHMTEYAILGLLVFAFLHSLGLRGKVRYPAALLAAACYAATDEFHQIFVPGRSAEFKDVCIDTAGAAIGLVILYFVLKIAGKRCAKLKHPIK